MPLQLVERLSVVRGRYYCPWSQIIPVEVRNCSNVSDVLQYYLVVAIASGLASLPKFHLIQGTVVLEVTQIKAVVQGRSSGS